MKDVIYFILKLYSPIDAKPQHSGYPVGGSSWCFYKKAIANGSPILEHNSITMSTYLGEDVQ